MQSTISGTTVQTRAWHVRSPRERLALLTGMLTTGVAVAPLSQCHPAFCPDCHGAPSAAQRPRAPRSPPLRPLWTTIPACLPPQAPFLRHRLARPLQRCLPEQSCQCARPGPSLLFLAERILLASSEARKNTHSLSFVGAARSPVASSEKMLLPGVFWEQLLPRMVWYVQSRASSCELK